jgi:hypothetical protein
MDAVALAVAEEGSDDGSADDLNEDWLFPVDDDVIGELANDVRI